MKTIHVSKRKKPMKRLALTNKLLTKLTNQIKNLFSLVFFFFISVTYLLKDTENNLSENDKA